MLDLGALTYSVVCDHFVRKDKLQCINLPRPILLFGVGGTGTILQAARFTYDIEGWTKTGWAYVAEDVNLGYDTLFGRSGLTYTKSTSRQHRNPSTSIRNTLESGCAARKECPRQAINH